MAATSPPPASANSSVTLPSDAPVVDTASDCGPSSAFDPVIPGWTLPIHVYPPVCSPLRWDEFGKREIYVLYEQTVSGGDISVSKRLIVYSTLSPPGLFIARDHGAYYEPPHAPGEPYSPEAIWPRYDPSWLLVSPDDMEDESLYHKPAPPCEGAHNFILEIRAQELFRRQPTVHPNMPVYLGCEVDCGWVVSVTFRRYPRTLHAAVESGERLNTSSIIAQLVDVVEYLHSLGVAHNDINPSNIMLTDDLRPILIDYDTCLPAGAPLTDKRGTFGFNEDDSWTTSAFTNDIHGIGAVTAYLERNVSAP